VTQIARPGCLLDLSTPTHLSLCAWHKAVCVLLLNGANSDSTVACSKLLRHFDQLFGRVPTATLCTHNERTKERLERKWAGLPGVVFAKYSTAPSPDPRRSYTRRTTTLWFVGCLPSFAGIGPRWWYVYHGKKKALCLLLAKQWHPQHCLLAPSPLQ
jgi:hypothetical protein